jgi:hypothetical protein
MNWFILIRTMGPRTAEILIRPAYADDYTALERLAALDSSDSVPPRPMLLAEVDGTLRAALSLGDGSSIADPFYPTVSLLALLRAHGEADNDGARSPGRLRSRRRGLGRPRLAHG